MSAWGRPFEEQTDKKEQGHQAGPQERGPRTHQAAVKDQNERPAQERQTDRKGAEEPPAAAQKQADVQTRNGEEMRQAGPFETGSPLRRESTRISEDQGPRNDGAWPRVPLDGPKQTLPHARREPRQRARRFPCRGDEQPALRVHSPLSGPGPDEIPIGRPPAQIAAHP